MVFTFGSKHVLLCGLVTLLLTYAAFHNKLPGAEAVSVQGRKGLSDPQVVPLVEDDVDATEGMTVEAEGVPKDAALADENVEFTQEDTADDFPEEKAVRELEEAVAPAPGDTSPGMVNPDPEYNPNPFLRQIQQNNAEAAKKEGVIQSCIAEDGCGTPE